MNTQPQPRHTEHPSPDQHHDQRDQYDQHDPGERPHPEPEHPFDVVGMIRRARRIADLSQRDLAHTLGVSPATIARWETRQASPSITMFEHICTLAGLHLTLTDPAGNPVPPMRDDALRDRAHRRRPAHLDIVAVQYPNPFRYDRPHQHVRVAHRRSRDDYRNHPERPRRITAPLGDNDHPTPSEVDHQHRHWAHQRQQAHAHYAAQHPAPPREPCHCLLECENTRTCTPPCPCQCEPPGTHWLT